MVRARALMLAFTAAFIAPVMAFDWSAKPFNPPSVPLAVRSPYLSTWLPQGAGSALNDRWATFWTGQVSAWIGYVKVDGKTYTFMGTPGNPGTTKAVQKSFSFTSTQSTFVLQAGGIDLTANFLSPVEPIDLVKQSTPFSYLAISAASNDGQAHSVQVYTDISGEWISGDHSWVANWTTTTGNTVTHQYQLRAQAPYSEVLDHIQHGAAYYSTLNTAGVTYQSGADTDVRGQFISNGKLANTKDAYFRAIDNLWPVVALSHDLGSVSAATAPHVYSIGHVRDPAVSYRIAGGKQQDRSLYFWSKYSKISDLISDFLKDYSAALSRATTLDKRVQSDASKISANYASLVALSIRQAVAATEITISKTSSGKWNTSDIKVFQKEISSNGNMNTVDVIFPAWPIWLYLNPALGKYLLLPLFEYQASGLYPNAWSIHDMGSHYPYADGHDFGTDESMPVEESGNMLIMTLSYTQKTKDMSLIKSYPLLRQWTQFLVNDSLIPAEQLSTDDFAGHAANQTNLAIKGILGIKAMGIIESLLGNTAQSTNYSNIATSYVNQFQQLAQSKTGSHLTFSYNQEESWGMAYNLWADKLLKTDLFPASLYEKQTAWYKTVIQPYGLPLDSRHATTWTKSDWQIFTAGTVTDPALRDQLIDSVVKYASDGANDVPLSDWYDASNGEVVGFQARPVAGGHLALLVI